MSTAGASRVRGPGRCAASTSTRVSSSTRAIARGSSDCAGTARVRHSASSAGALLPDGRVAYRLKKPRRNGATHLVMTPVQFLARIAILIPPPRYPLQRFAGVLAPHSSWRRAVVAMRPPTKLPRPGEPPRPPPPKKKKPKPRKKKDPADDLVFQYPGHPASGPANRPELPDPGRANTSLGAGLLTPWSGRMDWAALVQRVYLYDVLACPCGGARTILADVSDPELVRHILHDLGLPADPPHVARARDPTYDDAA